MNNEDRKDRKMDRNRNVELWVDALRSGLYKQGLACLHKNDEFCCLGIACEIYQREVGDLAVESNDFVSAYDGQTEFLPQKVQDWLGLYTYNGRFNETTSLAYMNDLGSSFEDIADVIESCPVGLFIKEIA